MAKSIHQHVWSHSSLKELSNCPAKFVETKIRKSVPFKGSKEMDFGNDVHKALELYVEEGKPLRKEHSHFQFMGDRVLRLARATGADPLCELQVGVKKDGSPSSFFGQEVYGRGKLDVLLLSTSGLNAVGVDYKTGKHNRWSVEDARQQGIRMAHFVFAKFPKLEKCSMLFMFPDEFKGRREQTWHYVRDNIEFQMEKTEELLHDLAGYLKEDKWPRRTGPLCAYCPVTKCPHNQSIV